MFLLLPLTEDGPWISGWGLISYSSRNNEIRIPIFPLFIFQKSIYIYIHARISIDSCRDEERNLDLFIVSSLQKRRLSSVLFLIPIHSFSNDPVSSAFLPSFFLPLPFILHSLSHDVVFKLIRGDISDEFWKHSSIGNRGI